MASGDAAVRRELDRDALMHEARELSGLTDFGDEAFAEPLGVLLECLAAEAHFHPAGLADFRHEVVRDLVNRLRFREDCRRHPEILDEDVSDPILVFGMPRTGTTKTQRMMGTDPSLLKTHMWELLNPAPFPDASPGDAEDPRIAAAAAGGGDLFGDSSQDVQAGHKMAVEAIEEDWTLFEHTFNDWYNNCRNGTRGWHEFVMSRCAPSDADNYRFVRSLFQYLQWQQGGRGGRRWLMKGCGHLAYMDELLETFPRATLVHCHRDPAVAVPSLAKLLFHVWQLRLTDVDPHHVGRLVFNWTRTSMDRYLAARDRLGLDDRVFDVPYEEIRNAPMPVFREIYRRAGHELTPEAEAGMARWEADNEQGRYGRHEYTLEEFGLTEAEIADGFGEYTSRFIN